jgi:SAM-dependent methyltransferase
MNAVPQGSFRLIHTEASEALVPLDPHVVALQELLRPPGPKPPGKELEPYSRAWFEELEIKRYTPHGDWLRRSLEFCRHKHEDLLMFGPGAGSDAIQYQRYGTQVTIAMTPDDCPALVERNFELRQLELRQVTMPSTGLIPAEAGSFDLAYLNLLYTPPQDLDLRIREIHRVLKSNGKIFVLAPARYDAGFWQRVFTPWRTWALGDGQLTTQHRYSARGLRRALPQFQNVDIAQRHLRRSELPYLWRSFPVSLLQRFMGRVMVFKGFKPLADETTRQPLRTAA